MPNRTELADSTGAAITASNPLPVTSSSSSTTQLPASLGSKADAASLAVTQSTEDKAVLAAMSGKLPATLGSKADTASLAVTQSTEDKAVLAALSAKLPATLGSKADASSLAVTQSTEDKAVLAAQSAKLPTLTKVAAATLTSVNSAATSATLKASNASRVGLMIHNTDTNALKIKYGATATTSIGGYTVKIAADGFWEMPQPIYTGVVDGIWDADGAGGASITEL
jgi:CDP-diacylglycerol pyrophosphatase